MQKTRNDKEIIEFLKAAGLRATRQRVAIGQQLFLSEDRHVTVEQIHIESLQLGYSVSLATVYNVLHRFTNAGLLRELAIDSGRSYFDTNISSHQHLYFEDTGKLCDMPGDNIEIKAIPSLPPDTAISRIDVIIRVKNKT